MHFETVIEDANVTFVTENARRALDEWMNLVIDSAKEMKDFYTKGKLSKAVLVARQ